ncbi:C-type lectin domain family 4 member C-like isoform X2 [Castor canadensis]|uniref:C-type lectin domain family 4 member C-like isoform X2 n=3 Tax=Castor canadensis TaxID=51338 RepID=A0AC58MS39_CASCN
MALEGQNQDNDKELRWFQVKVWSVAMTSISLLTACFLVSSLVTHNSSMYSKIGKRLSKLTECRKYHSSLTCTIKGKEEEGSWDCCPTLWRPFQSSCYFISTELLSWAESRNSCLAMGADLVVITTKNEQDFIIQNLNIDSDYYVGLLDPEGQNHWQWVDQTPYNQSATFWHTKEPNMLDERCVAVNFRKEESRHWGWNDVHCHIPLKSVCETKICL